MKRCSNPNCESSFLFGDSNTHCPFCHAPLIDSAAAERPLITPIDEVMGEDGAAAATPFVIHRLGSVQCTGRIIEIEHQALFYSKYHKIFNAVFRGEPFQLAHQSVEYTIRVEPITDGLPAEVTDFCLFGNYLGRLQVGDEVQINAKDCGHRRVVRSVVNLTTDSRVRPGLQIGAPLIRGLLLAAMLLLVVAAYSVVHFFESGAAAAVFAMVLAAVMPIVISLFGLWLLFRSVFPGRRERRRRE